MELNERAEEALETLWIATNEDGRDGVALSVLESKAIEELLKNELVSKDESKVRLTEAGMPEAESVVRRHRLAERLLTDVLGARDSEMMHEKACKFEHLLDRGLDESICTLLGHPKICPHGKPIPPGACCLEQGAAPTKVVSPLSQLSPGESGRVAYIYAPETDKLQKLMAMGILPGAAVKLIQDFPSYVFAAGETQFAVDKEIAEAIYVRLVEEPAAAMSGRGKGKGRQQRKMIQRPGKGGKGRRRFGFFG
jgi:DtxR family Mn-dependent transcriptional regulator